MTATVASQAHSERVRSLANNIAVVSTAAGEVLVNSPPETIKFLLAAGLGVPSTILLPPDIPPGQQLGSSGFVHQGICYASVEFPVYFNFFVRQGVRTRLITVTEHQAKRLRQILLETISGPVDSDEYGSLIWLRDECDAVSIYPPLGRALRVDDLVTIQSLDQGGGDLGPTQIRFEHGRFVFAEQGVDVVSVSPYLSAAPMPPTFTPPRPLLRQELTLQFVGGSHGFDPSGITTCFLAYLDPHRPEPTLFDAAAYLRARLGSMGISSSQICDVVLSHLHEDHLAGLPELILLGGNRIRLLTSSLIYRGLLRVLSAMLDVSEHDVAALFDYQPLDPGYPVMLDGLKYRAIYALHSIPTIAVRVGGLCYSGDMRYDEEWFGTLESQGALSASRRAELVSFADGASLLVQDVGGGSIHTTLTPEVFEALASKSRRLVLAHTSTHQLPPTERADLVAQVEFAGSGHVVAMGPTVDRGPIDDRLASLSASPLFARLPMPERLQLAAQAREVSYAANDVILPPANGDHEIGMLIVHSGLVEVRHETRVVHLLGRGTDLGAYRSLQQGGALVAHGDVQLLELDQASFAAIAKALGIDNAIERVRWLSHSQIFAATPWSTLIDLALDFEVRQYQPGEQLFHFGDIGLESYLLVNGSVSIFDQQGQQINELHQSGTFFGGRAALYGLSRNAAAVASQPSEIWALSVPALRRFHIVYPGLVLHLRAAEAALSAPPFGSNGH